MPTPVDLLEVVRTEGRNVRDLKGFAELDGWAAGWFESTGGSQADGDVLIRSAAAGIQSVPIFDHTSMLDLQSATEPILNLHAYATDGGGSSVLVAIRGEVASGVNWIGATAGSSKSGTMPSRLGAFLLLLRTEPHEAVSLTTRRDQQSW